MGGDRRLWGYMAAGGEILVDFVFYEYVYLYYECLGLHV